MALDDGHDFKRTETIRGGFEYQDLVAVEVLIRFLRDRSLYEWIQVEAEDKAYQAIDDVVACRKDGSIELTQVKFTPDPQDPNRSLNWEWLTQRKPSGTSLLQKWSKTVLRHRENCNLAQALLKTDRVPDLDFAKCLKESLVMYERLTSKMKEIVNDQIGSEEMAVAFFGMFEFKHSLQRLDDYEKSLRSMLEYDTDRNGWAYFRQEVRHWAMRKNAPPLDGKIRHFHLLHVFAPDRAESLRQDFLVPLNYKVPDNTFHQEFINEAANTDGVVVLWGPPGRGKSTYLSHCVSELVKRTDVLCIRHHYFLGLNEIGEGRFSYFAIERSLIQQLIDLGITCINQREGLANSLSAAASELSLNGRRLIVVIDGLDHVWRENGDLVQMELLFGSLFPLPEGVRLLVGTQKVEDEHLPRKLLKALPKDRWTELPTMSVTAVLEWLKSHPARDQLCMAENPEEKDEEVLVGMGEAFHEISAGMPLHLVYSFEALLKSGQPLELDTVLRLPACPSGEIEEYYESLWVGLSSGAKRVLHLLAGLRFGPPSFGLGKFLSTDVNWWQVLEEIGHLLDCREASVIPFHGSLFAFLRECPSHKKHFNSLAINVLDWLREGAPEYWRRAWLWVMCADLEDSSDLVHGPSREWSINWLVSGYPVNQLVFILGQAEEAALELFDVPRLIRLRCLKSRAVNFRQFQSNEWGSFWEMSLAMSKDENLGAALWDNLLRLETEELSAVAIFGRGVPADSERQVIKELERRRSIWLSSEDREHWDTYLDAIIRMVARQPEENSDVVFKLVEKIDADGLVNVYSTESLKVGNYQNVLATELLQKGHGVNRNMFEALCLEGIGPSTNPDFLATDRPALACLTLMTNGEYKGSKVEADVSYLWRMRDDHTLGHAVRHAGHLVFFTSLRASPADAVPRFGTAFGYSIRGSEGEVLRVSHLSVQMDGEFAARFP